MVSEKVKNEIETIQKYFGNVSGKTVLDIGVVSGKLPYHLSNLGAKVTAIDINPLAPNILNEKNYEFIQIPFEYFNTEDGQKFFDIAIAINTLPFLVDKKHSMKKFLTIANAQFFNVWGSNHAWAKNKLTYSPEEIEQLKAQITKSHEILYFQENEHDSREMLTGDTGTHWHEYYFAIKKLPGSQQTIVS